MARLNYRAEGAWRQHNELLAWKILAQLTLDARLIGGEKPFSEGAPE